MTPTENPTDLIAKLTAERDTERQGRLDEMKSAADAMSAHNRTISQYSVATTIGLFVALSMGLWFGNEGGKHKEAKAQLQAIVGKDFDIQQPPSVLRTQLEKKFAAMNAEQQTAWIQQIATFTETTLSEYEQGDAKALLKSAKEVQQTYAEKVAPKQVRQL